MFRFVCAAFAVAAVYCPVTVSAGILTKGDIVKLTRHNSGEFQTYGGGGGGGEFAMGRKNDNNGWDHLAMTFCLEVDEHVHLNKEVVVGGISDTAIWGGNGQVGRPVASTTKVLYDAYATGELSFQEIGSELIGFEYENDSWANDLQQAIWHLQDQSGYKVYDDLSGDVRKLVDFAEANKDDWNFSGTVYAVNLFREDAASKQPSAWEGFDSTDSNTWHADLFQYRVQDQLYHFVPPPPTSSLPEPSSIVVLGLTFLGGLIPVVRRRRRGLSAV